jgi:hypothetical protein
MESHKGNFLEFSSVMREWYTIHESQYIDGQMNRHLVGERDLEETYATFEDCIEACKLKKSQLGPYEEKEYEPRRHSIEKDRKLIRICRATSEEQIILAKKKAALGKLSSEEKKLLGLM